MFKNHSFSIKLSWKEENEKTTYSSLPVEIFGILFGTKKLKIDRHISSLKNKFLVKNKNKNINN